MTVKSVKVKNPRRAAPRVFICANFEP